MTIPRVAHSDEPSCTLRAPSSGSSGNRWDETQS